MHLEINDNTTFREIQETFSTYYPYLKIDFFHKPNKKYEASSESDRLEPNTVVGGIKLVMFPDYWKFKPSIELQLLRKNSCSASAFLFNSPRRKRQMRANKRHG